MATDIILAGISREEFEVIIQTTVRTEIDRILPNQSMSIPEPNTEPEFITRKETAKILGITLTTLNEWTKTGIIPAKRIGTRVRYLKTDVYAALKDIETIKYRRF